MWGVRARLGSEVALWAPTLSGTWRGAAPAAFTPSLAPGGSEAGGPFLKRPVTAGGGGAVVVVVCEGAIAAREGVPGPGKRPGAPTRRLLRVAPA